MTRDVPDKGQQQQCQSSPTSQWGFSEVPDTSFSWMGWGLRRHGRERHSTVTIVVTPLHHLCVLGTALSLITNHPHPTLQTRKQSRERCPPCPKSLPVRRLVLPILWFCLARAHGSHWRCPWHLGSSPAKCPMSNFGEVPVIGHCRRLQTRLSPNMAS